MVGWYHSHPYAPAAPTLRDVDAQLDYQIRMKGSSDNSYTPCIGVILCMYKFFNLESFENEIKNKDFNAYSIFYNANFKVIFD